MDVQLFRIDDRLIHGQVVLGWAAALNSKSIILCDNSVFENDWEKELYLSCVPDDLQTRILNIERTIDLLKQENNNLEKTILLVQSPYIVEEIVDKGIVIPKINVGGIHFREGRKKVLPYLYLDADEINSFRRCMDKGVYFECLDVPTGNNINLKTLI